MRSVDPGPNYSSWRSAALLLIAAKVDPAQVIFEKNPSLFSAELPQSPAPQCPPLKIAPDLLNLIKTAACHSDPKRWDLLYRILYRSTVGKERHLHQITSDPDISAAHFLAKNVRREIHKLHAFVRFKKVETDQPEVEQYAAWFEPDHHIIELGAPFFRKRFTNMNWSILTPRGCAHWDQVDLTFSPGLQKNPFLEADESEASWLTYYRSIFNPARVKVKAMQAEMPKKYWKNLPEAELIPKLIAESKSRVTQMSEEPLRPAKKAPNNKYLQGLYEPTDLPSWQFPQEGQSLAEIQMQAGTCRACPLYKHATGTVFGTGPEDARIMIVGEQPGDQEDVAGKPFVGPAGRLLSASLEAAGIDREATYLTNAVKHFKWIRKDTPRGKIRLHQSPAKSEIDACRPWVLGELNRVAPEVLIILGATAAKSLLTQKVSVTKDRGLIHAPHLAPTVILTVHPSYLLRIPKNLDRAKEERRFVEDLSIGNTNIT